MVEWSRNTFLGQMQMNEVNLNINGYISISFRIEEQLYHNMMNARNNNNFDRQFERYQDVMMDQKRFDQQQQQQYQMNRQNQMINQLINMNQRNTFGRFFEQQRPLYSHR